MLSARQAALGDANGPGGELNQVASWASSDASHSSDWALAREPKDASGRPSQPADPNSSRLLSKNAIAQDDYVKISVFVAQPYVRPRWPWETVLRGARPTGLVKEVFPTFVLLGKNHEKKHN